MDLTTPKIPAEVRPSAFLQSILSRCSELQNWSEEDLDFNLPQLKEVDELLHGCVTRAESDRL